MGRSLFAYLGRFGGGEVDVVELLIVRWNLDRVMLDRDRR